jgi:hypothetical protein
VISHLRLGPVLSATLLGVSCFLIGTYKFISLFSFTQAMVIIAWNGGTPSDIFDKGVFTQVLSIFITAAVIKFGQGRLAIRQ